MSDKLTLQDRSRMRMTAGASTPSAISAIQTGALLRIADALEKMVAIDEADTSAAGIQKLIAMVEEERHGKS